MLAAANIKKPIHGFAVNRVELNFSHAGLCHSLMILV